MAHIHRRGNVDQVTLPVKLTASVPTATINPGDLVCQISNFIVPITAIVWDTDTATTQLAAVVAFVGMANTRSRIGSTDARDLTISIDQDGDVEFDCASATYVFGDYIGAKKAAGNALLQTVVGVATKNLAVAVVMEGGTTVTRVLGRLINTFPKKIFYIDTQ